MSKLVITAMSMLLAFTNEAAAGRRRTMRRIAFWIWALLINLSVVHSAHALNMNFTINEDEKLLYMHLWGTIDRGDGEKFKSLVLPYIQSGYLLFEVRVFTPGGNVSEAMSIGDQIRTLQAMTVAPTEFINEPGYVQCWFVNWAGKGGVGFSPDHNFKTHKSTGEGPQWCTCASACFDIWASGSSRSGNVVGIHRIRPNGNYGTLSVDEAKSTYDRIEEQTRAYLAKLNIPSSIIDRMFATGYGSIYFLNHAEIQLLTTTPYLEELENAKCPADRTVVQYDSNGNWVSTTEDPVRINCNREILKEMMREGAAKYLAAYGGGAPLLPQVAPTVVGPGAVPPVPYTAPNPPAKPSLPATYWAYNGSAFRLDAEQNKRRFIFIEPRDGLKDEGVTSGMAEFEGVARGHKYRGTAFVFSRLCGPIAYRVTGYSSEDYRRVTLSGQAPYVDSGCQKISEHATELEFELMEGRDVQR